MHHKAIKCISIFVFYFILLISCGILEADFRPQYRPLIALKFYRISADVYYMKDDFILYMLIQLLSISTASYSE